MAIQLVKFDFSKGKGMVKCVPSLFGIIRDHFSIEDKKKKAVARHYADHYIDPRSYAISPTGQFDVWFASEIVKFLKSRKINFSLEATDAFKEAFSSKFDFEFNPNDNIFELDLKLREYQREGVKLALERGNGIFLYPTSAGKTLTMATTVKNILKRKPNAKILIVTLTHLVNQLYNDFESYGMNMKGVGKWTGDNAFDDGNNVIIAGSTILGNHLTFNLKEYEKQNKIIRACKKGLNVGGNDKETVKELRKQLSEAEAAVSKMDSKVQAYNKIKTYIENVYAVFIDEVHQCKKSNIVTKLFSKLNTKHRFGYTGTMPNDKIDEWTILGNVGPLRQIVNRDMLVENGNITDVEVRFVDLHYKRTPNYEAFDEDNWQVSLENFRIESEFLYKSEFRNDVIAKICTAVPKNILVLVDRIEHGEYLKNKIQEMAPNKRVVFIYGEIDKDERERVRVEMESSDNLVCIAITKIFSTGVSIKNIHFLLFAVAWKTRVSIIQSIGRGVRAMAGKERVVLFDLHDCLRYGTKHYIERMEIYKNEGFETKNKSVNE